jgi:hypothetical protein
MKLKTTKLKPVFRLMLAVALPFLAWSVASAEVEWAVKQTLDLKTTPVDVAVSPDWQKLFILTESGDIQIYSGNGVLIDTITVGTHVDKITVGPQGSVLILKSSQDKKIQIVTLDFIQNINVAGSPYKGADDAPVVIAVFSDFE